MTDVLAGRHPSTSVAPADADEAVYRGVRIRLEAFDGPLDLLLHLIQRDEIDIYDIPIARITRQYLETLELMRELDLEVAGDYLVMAATLIRIKSQMLLPRPVIEDDGDEIDPREELVRRLIEYRRFKAAAGAFKEMETDRRRWHGRNVSLPPLPPEELPVGSVSVFDLLSYMKDVLSRYDEEPTHAVEVESVSLEERIEALRAGLAREGRFQFSHFLRDVRTRMGVIVSFMALLELMKLGEISVEQDEPFSDFLVVGRDPVGLQQRS